jgi:hypothetical protein
MMALGQKSDYKVAMSHKKVFDAEQAKAVLGLATSKMGAYKEVAELLATNRYTDVELMKYFQTVFAGNNKKRTGFESKIADFEKYATRNANRAYEITETQPGAYINPGSWWNAFNAVTFMTDHELGRSDDSRLTSAWYGMNRLKKIKALEGAVELAQAA